MTSICSDCGVIATKSAWCVHCGSRAPSIDVAARTDGKKWICLECTFKCRMCGFQVPLNGLDMDGSVTCARCSLEQAFDVGQWRVVFEEAHATGDLWGDQADEFSALIDGQYLALGKANASLAFNGAGENAVSTIASPGNPLCDACHRPLDVTLGAPDTGHASTSCECGKTATYEVPLAARRMSLPLTAILCSEHRADRKDVRVEATASAIAVRCPGCDAPLPADGESKFVTCAYCHTQARIPDRTWFKLSKKEHVPEKMWLLFEGPSGTRNDLLEKRRANREVLDEQARARKKREEGEAREAAEAAKRVAANERSKKRREEERAAEAAEAVHRERQKADAKRTERITTIGIVAAVAIGAVATGIVETEKDNERATARLAIENAPTCDAKTPDVCMSTAKKSLGDGNYGPAIDDYETACDAGYAPACTAVDALCQSTKIGISSRLTHYERYCAKGQLDACNSAGTLYVTANGDGLAKDESAASKLFQKSCDGGNKAGCDLLAQSCKRGVVESCPSRPDSGRKSK